jgi:DNA polymerase-4
MSRSQLRRSAGPGRLGTDDTGCTILHVEMDAFYASVSLLQHPELVGRPVIVGGAGGRGVVLSATYEARASGVHSAMPMSRARRLAPDAVIIPPDFGAYSAASAAVMEIFRSITPAVEPLSLDEAFLDVAGSVRRLGRPAQIAALVRARVHDEQGITCSVGVASTKFVAKIASAGCKPDGLLVVPADEVLAFLHPMPVGALWGVGEKTEERLHRLGLRTVGQVAGMPRTTLVRALGQAAGAHLHDLAWGRDPRPVAALERERSIGADETFATDIDDPEIVRAELLRLADKVAGRLRRAGLVGRTVSIKVRFADFTTITRSRTLRDTTDVAQDIYRTASALYDGLGLQRVRLRLVGVRVEHLVDAASASEQLLIGAPEHGWRDAERAVDRVREKYGGAVVRPARLLGPSAATVPDASLPRPPRAGPGPAPAGPAAPEPGRADLR